MKPSCKTCFFWEPFNAVCLNAYSQELADFTDRDYSCKCWEANKCKECGGVMEAVEENGKIWHHCHECKKNVQYIYYLNNLTQKE